MALAVPLIAAWMLGVAVICVAERRNIADNPDLWVGSKEFPLLVLGWPVSLVIFLVIALSADRDEDR
jgi:hypothetical protein